MSSSERLYCESTGHRRVMDVEARRGDHRALAIEIVAHHSAARASDAATNASDNEGPLLRHRAAVSPPASPEEGKAGCAVSDDALIEEADAGVLELYVVLRCNRLRNFERWVSGIGIKDPRPAGVISWWSPIVMEGNVEQIGFATLRGVCPVNLEEALETRNCIIALPDYLKDAIIQEYIVGGTRLQKARNLEIEPRAFKNRLRVAHGMLLELFKLADEGLPLIPRYRGPGRPKRGE